MIMREREREKLKVLNFRDSFVIIFMLLNLWNILEIFGN